MAEKKVPIRGWLILIGIILWGTAISSTFGFIGSFFIKITNAYPNWVEILFMFFGMVLSVTAIVFFLQRRKIFNKWFIGLQIWSILQYLVQLVTGTSIANDIFGIVFDILLILYILRSKRVLNTFNR